MWVTSSANYNFANQKLDPKIFFEKTSNLRLIAIPAWVIISSLIISKLMYCSTVWSNTSATNIKKLQAVQNFACKIIMNTRKYDHVTPALRQLKWLPVRDLLVYRETVMSYKCMNNIAPSYLCDRFVKRTGVHNRCTRNCGMLEIPFFRTVTGQRSFY